MSADFSAFSNQTFDAASWINSTVSECPEDEALESFLASLAMKLHIISQDYTDQLETGMVEATTIMPRIQGEVSRIEDILHSLETEMSALATQLHAFDQRNVAGVEDLSRMDTLKNNITKCKATLEEHARWSQLVREAKTFMEAGGRLSDSADRLETMFRSCSVLKNMPGHEERISTCEKFRESLLTALRPRVRQDVTTSDVSPLHEYLYVYDKLSKREELEEEYSKARPEMIKDLWIAVEETGESSFVSGYSDYLAKIVTFFCEEFDHMGSLFGPDRAPMLLSAMIKTALDPVRMNLVARLTSMKRPEMVAEAYRIADKAAVKLVPCLFEVEKLLGPGGPRPTAFNPSDSTKVNEPEKLYDAMESYFGGFISLLDTYTELESVTTRCNLERGLEDILFKVLRVHSVSTLRLSENSFKFVSLHEFFTLFSVT